MALTISNGTDTVSFADATAAFTGTTGAYWTRAPYRGKRYGIERVDAPATAGFIVKRHDFRGRAFGPLLVWYINTSASNCIAAYVADAAKILNKQLTLTLVGHASPFPSCSCESFEPLRGSPQQSGTNLYRLPCILILEQDRET